jgi:predicted transcriptional regulator
MEHERFIFDAEPQAEEEALRRAEAEAAAGKGIPHDEVAKWLRTWGTPQSGPPPKSWLE